MAERRGALGRLILSWLFLILFCLSAPLALLAGWARLTVLDTEAYAQTVRRIADDQQVQDAVAAAVASAVQTRLAGENPTATEVLQARAPAEAIGEAMRDVAASDTFRDVWESANRSMHRLLFEGLQEGAAQPVALDLSPLLDPLQAEIAARNLLQDLPAGFALDAGDLRLDVLDATAADRLRRAMTGLDLTFWAALATALISVLLSIALTADRLAALGRAGFGLAIAMVGLIALIVVAQEWTASAAGAGRLAIVAVVEAVSQGLRVAAVALALAGLLLAGICSSLRALRGTRVRGAIAVD